jgi:putative transposase
MVTYRRNLVPGGTYFFTVTLQDRSANWLIAHIHFLRSAFQKARKERPFRIDAIVILPDHLHCVWTLPQGDADYAQRWHIVKSNFSHSLHRASIVRKRNRKGGLDIWQRGYWEHAIRDEANLETHVNYIHYNPVKHRLVGHVRDWPYSSFHRFVRIGMLDLDWAGGSGVIEGSFGE